jgi:hypothetical protein
MGHENHVSHDREYVEPLCECGAHAPLGFSQGEGLLEFLGFMPRVRHERHVQAVLLAPEVSPVTGKEPNRRGFFRRSEPTPPGSARFPAPGQPRLPAP